MKIIIMQGLPGSGKSTWIERNYPRAIVCSADHFFTDPERGEYKFDPQKIGEAHKTCLRNFAAAAKTLGVAYSLNAEYKRVIVVDNTNLSLWEMAPYVQLGAAYNVPVEVVRIRADPEVCASRNVHSVPRDVILRMAGRMEKPLKFWECTYTEVGEVIVHKA